jgi:hypothetical protein
LIKKALIVVNADVTVAYDLHKMKYDIDEKQNNFYFKYSKEEIKLVVIFNFMMWTK